MTSVDGNSEDQEKGQVVDENPVTEEQPSEEPGEGPEFEVASEVEDDLERFGESGEYEPEEETSVLAAARSGDALHGDGRGPAGQRFPRKAFGYDRAVVDAYLDRLEQSTGGADPAGPPAAMLAPELEGIGVRIDGILDSVRETGTRLLGEAKAAAERLKRESEEAAEQATREADAYAEKTRKSADEYDASTKAAADAAAEETRDAAQRDAEAARAAAEEEAEGIVTEARADLKRIEGQIEQLRERRRTVLAGIEEMRGRLGSMVGEVEQGTTEFRAAAAALDADESEDGDGESEGADGDDAPPAIADDTAREHAIVDTTEADAVEEPEVDEDEEELEDFEDEIPGGDDEDPDADEETDDDRERTRRVFVDFDESEDRYWDT